MDWIAVACTFLGRLLLARQVWQAWVLKLAADGLWAWWGAAHAAWGVVALSAVFVPLDVYALRVWYIKAARTAGR